MDEREIYIHIGLHKTATTFLQKEVFPNLENINFIPQEKILPFLVSLSLDDLSEFDVQKNKAFIDGFLQGGKNLISAEGLSGNPLTNYDNRTSIIIKIKKIFPNAKIIIGIRSQKTLIRSIYQQYIRIGGTKTVSEFFNTKATNSKAIYAYGRNSLDPLNFCYQKYLTAVHEKFGTDNIMIYLFEKLKHDKHSFVNDFCDFFSVDKPNLVSDKIVNRAFPKNAYGLLRFYNNVRKSYVSEKGLLKGVPLDMIIMLSKFRFKKNYKYKFDELVDRHKKIYSENNLMVARQFNVPINEAPYKTEYFL